MKKTKLKVGDKIIKCSKVYRVFEVQKRKTADKEETIILYKPYFKTEYNKNIILSVPVDSLDRANIRFPMTKKELKIFFKDLSQKISKKAAINIVSAKEILNRNDFGKIIEVLKNLIIEKNDETINFTKSKQDILNLSINYFVEEVAFVGGFSLIQAEKKIYKALNLFNSPKVS